MEDAEPAVPAASPAPSVSIVVPTYKRPQLLRRILRYFSDGRLPYEVIVADSSPDRASEEVTGAATGLRLRYQHYSPDTFIAAKVADVLSSVNSKYAVLCADDDFLVWTFLIEGCRFLDENPSFSIVHGRSVMLIPTAFTGEVPTTFCSVQYPQSTIVEAGSADRLQKHLADYKTTLYSVHRREQLLRNMQLTARWSVDYRFGELLPSCLSLVQGKAQTLDMLHMIRQGGPGSTAGLIAPWETLLTAPDYSRRYQQFCACLVSELERETGIEKRAAECVVNRAFLSYLRVVLRDPAGTAHATRISYLAEGWARVRRLIHTLVAAAAAHRDLGAPALTSPRATYRKLRRRMEDEMSLEALLEPRSRFHSAFAPVYELIRAYPAGLP
jgi:glycosyltransferase domain-containing protein